MTPNKGENTQKAARLKFLFDIAAAFEVGCVETGLAHQTLFHAAHHPCLSEPQTVYWNPAKRKRRVRSKTVKPPLPAAHVEIKCQNANENPTWLELDGVELSTELEKKSSRICC